MIYLRLYERTGQTLLGLLPNPISYQFGVEFSDIGAISFDYPASGVNADLLTEFREVAVFDDFGNEYANARFVITNINRDRVSPDGFITVTGRGVLSRLDTALAYPDGGIASGALTRYFDNKNAGYILRTLIDSAQTRGALTGISCDFTTTADSNSITWADAVTQEYPARNTILSILRSLQDYGIVEVQTVGTNLKATRGDGLGTDRTTGLDPVVLRYGRNLTEAPEQRSADRVATVALVEADGGLIVERTNSTGVTAYGRIETSFTASGTDDTATANALGDTYLGNLATTARQLTVGLTFEAGTPRPLKDFTVGDYVYTATASGLERVRVRQITVSMSGGNISATATLGDRIFENEIRTSRKLAAISSGSVALGNGNLIAPVVDVVLAEDTVAPSPATSLTGSTAAYVDGTEPRASVSLTWTAPTTNADGSALTDLAYYEVQIRTGSTDTWEFEANAYTNSAKISGLTVATSYRFRVFAVDNSGNLSTASNEYVVTAANLTATEVTPSAPTVSSRLGTISITWNGLGSGGQGMSSTFDYAAVHVSTTNGFTPSSTTYEGRLAAGGVMVLSDLTYNTTYYVKLVAYTKSGVPSAASAQASASVQPLVDADIIANTISGAKIASGTITASDKIIANTITGGLIQALAISADKIQANAITADKIEAGAITASKIQAGSIGATQISSSYVYAGTIAADKITAGTITASVSFNAASGTFTGTVNASAGTIGGFTLSSTSISAGSSLIIQSNGTISGGNSQTIFYGYANIGGGTAGSERLIVTGNSNFNGQAIFTSNVTSQTHFFIPFANNVTSAANGFVVGLPGGSGRMTYTTASSARYKHDITPLRDVPDMEPRKLLDLPVRAFRYNSDYVSQEDDRAEVLMPGFIAEEVDAVYPIAADYDGGQVNSWNERMIVPGMLALIQDLTKELAEIKATLNGETV